MADGNLTVPAGTVDTRTTAGGEHRQVVALGNDGDRVVSVMPWGALETFTGLATMFYDSWSGSAPDTVDKWQVTGTAPSLSGGNMTMPTGAGYHAVRTQDVIRPNAGFTVVRNGIQTEGATPGTGASRFVGLGTVASSPTATSLAQEGVGFEWSAAGALSAVVYSGGVKTFTQALTRPTDGAVHAYEVQFRVTGVTWHIDNVQAPVASASFPTIALVELPALIAIFNATPTGVTWTNIAHLTGDSSRQHLMIADPVIGTRQARVTDPASSITGAMGSTPALSTGNDASTGAAVNVNPNAIQKATYKFTAQRTNANLTAATIQWQTSLHHAAGATKTVRVRRIVVSASVPATAQSMRAELHWVGAAPTGTAVAAGAATATAGYKGADGRNANAEAVALNTVTAATSTGLIDSVHLASSNAAALHGGGATLYDWQESGETQPITLRAGVLEGIAIGFVSTAALTAGATMAFTTSITFTEE